MDRYRENNPTMEDYKKAAVLENEFEAQLRHPSCLKGIFPHLLRSYHDTAFDGLFQTQKGWGYVERPFEQKGWGGSSG
jgi:hypothetical protein